MSALDSVCGQAVDMARAAAVEDAGEYVGDYLGVSAEGDRLATHRFAATQPGYRGWAWSVTVVRAPRARGATVAEVALLPGEGALLAPDWVPWIERLQPGDVGVGDILPTSEDDERLAPAYASLDDAEADAVAWELGLGRVRVLSLAGRDDAAERWYEGARGPQAPIAEAAPARCGTCGFLAQLSGAMRQVFGVCANEFAPDDGQVVSLDHGCGAHSEAVVVPSTPRRAPSPLGEYAYEPAEPDESLGHS